jgi:MOSC domain-containing protein YiiM
MTVISVNTGRPAEVHANNRTVRTSIWKTARAGRLRVRKLNIEGDEQSDLTVHGGPRKAVYLYPSEHYAFWQEQLPGMDLPWGAFGENLTTEGLAEAEVRIGDRMEIGTAEFEVTQSRQPCFKLAIRFGRGDMIKRFYASGRSGFYVSVVREGDIGSGDEIRITKRASRGPMVSEMFAMKAADKP